MRKGLLVTGATILIALLIMSCGGDDASTPTGSSNSAPGTPTLDSPSGAPTNGATGLSIAPTLRWKCTDPDGDALKYTVSFGTTTPPSAVSTDQTGLSYSPPALKYSTKYYWSITAKDPSGKTTSSAIWNFTTMANSAPGTPTLDGLSGAPTNGATDISIAPTLWWQCTDPDGDSLKYTVSFDTTTPPLVISTDQTGLSYSPPTLKYSTKYYWSITAKDPSGATTTSPVWDFTTMTAPIEQISVPDAPSGPTSGETSTSFSYTTTGSSSTLDHSVEYRFEDGDGNYTTWGSAFASFSWSSEGSYDVTAQARCVDHPLVVSDWSASTPVIISDDVETVSIPGTPSGGGTAEEGASLNFTTTASISSKGHQVVYRWNFGDGAPSSWSSTRTRSHSWTTAGTYEVTAQARCSSDPLIMSGWSGPKTVVITVPAAETVSTPDAPTAPATGTVNVALAVFVSGASSSLGHSIQYKIDFGDGQIANWDHYNIGVQHAYDAVGTYEIRTQARCINHNDILSEWSEITSIEISNPPEALTYNTNLVYGDVVNGEINQSYEYTVSHSPTTNLSDPMEGQYDWGDGNTSAWVQAAERNQSHTWTAEGTYNVTYTGRCTVHNDFTFTTAPLVVTIVTEAVETISTPVYNPNFATTPDIGVPTNYYTIGGASSLGHEVESRIDWGDGTPMTDWIIGFVPISKTWTDEGTFELIRQTRCVEHPEIISEWSSPINISPRGPETVSTPDTPNGPATGPKGQLLYYTSGGALSSWGHANYIEYRYDYGDGSALSNWVTNPDGSHRYNIIGEFEVKSQARCSYPSGHDNPESEWSLPAVVTIVESITGAYIHGPDFGPINRSFTFEVRGARSDVSHILEYQIDFGDGTISNWSLTATADHTYLTAGIFDVLCRARCAEHTEAVSDWSTGHPMDITDAPETISAPGYPQTYVSDNEYNVGEEMTISSGLDNAESDYGDSLQYQIDYGDGTISDWFPSTYSGIYGYYISTKYTYSTVGSMDIKTRARCALHTEVLSEWSPPTSIIVYEGLEDLIEPTGPIAGNVGEDLIYNTIASTSSEGDALEYKFVFRSQYSFFKVHESPWSSLLAYTYAFDANGTYRLQIEVRCIEHPFINDVSPILNNIVITD